MEYELNIDFEKIKEIFEMYNKKVLEKEDINWGSLEKDLKTKFGYNYQTTKMIIVKYFQQGLYKDLCYQYAKYNDTVEMKQIIKEYEK